MRALFWISGLLAALWSGYWFAGAYGIERSAESWFAQQQQNGVLAGHESLVVHGFPNRFDLTVMGPDLADPATGLRWTAPFVQVFAMTWKPWHLIAALPPEQIFTLSDQRLTLTSTRLMGSLMMIPGADLALDEIVGEGEGLNLASSLGWEMAAEKLVVSTRLDPSPANTHRLGLSVTNLAPDPALAQAAGLEGMISDARLDAHLGLSAPLDRHSAETNPRITNLDLTEAHLTWGSFKLSAKGSLVGGADGLAMGEITLRIEDWRALPRLLTAMGYITPGFAPSLEKGLEVMANAGADPDVLILPLKAAGGQMSLGPFPLGPAPRLYRQ